MQLQSLSWIKNIHVYMHERRRFLSDLICSVHAEFLRLDLLEARDGEVAFETVLHHTGARVTHKHVAARL